MHVRWHRSTASSCAAAWAGVSAAVAAEVCVPVPGPLGATLEAPVACWYSERTRLTRRVACVRGTEPLSRMRVSGRQGAAARPRKRRDQEGGLLLNMSRLTCCESVRRVERCSVTRKRDLTWAAVCWRSRAVARALSRCCSGPGSGWLGEARVEETRSRCHSNHTTSSPGTGGSCATAAATTGAAGALCVRVGLPTDRQLRVAMGPLGATFAHLRDANLQPGRPGQLLVRVAQHLANPRLQYVGSGHGPVRPGQEGMRRGERSLRIALQKP